MFVLTCSIIQLTFSILHSQECYETHATKYQGGFHSNIMIRPDNKVVVWGDPTPLGIKYTPTEVQNLAGTPIEVGTSGAPWNEDGWGWNSMFIRTTTKFYGHGTGFLPATFNTPVPLRLATSVAAPYHLKLKLAPFSGTLDHIVAASIPMA